MDLTAIRIVHMVLGTTAGMARGLFFWDLNAFSPYGGRVFLWIMKVA